MNSKTVAMTTKMALTFLIIAITILFCEEKVQAAPSTGNSLAIFSYRGVDFYGQQITKMDKAMEVYYDNGDLSQVVIDCEKIGYIPKDTTIPFGYSVEGLNSLYGQPVVEVELDGYTYVVYDFITYTIGYKVGPCGAIMYSYTAAPTSGGTYGM